jgi:hypothetical protein
VRIADWLWENPMLRPERARWERRRLALGAFGRGLDLLVFLVTYTATAFCLAFVGQDSTARAYLLCLCLLYLLWVNIRTPGPSAASISGERDRGSWEILRLTALRPSQVVAAKYLVGVWPSVVTLGWFVPPILISSQAAALPVARAAALLGVLVAAPFPAVALALWLSGRCRHTRTAAALAYLLTGFLFWNWLVWDLAGAVSEESPWGYACPLWHVRVLCLGGSQYGLSYWVRTPRLEWVWFLLGCGAFSALALTLLTRRVAESEA